MIKKDITIYDIAKEAGVSPATVSRVLNGTVNVRSEKKEKILEVIRKYNFRPNALARGLSDTRTKIIGMLAADIRNPFYAMVFVACEQAAMERGYTLMLFNSLNHNELEEHYLEKFEEQRVDGVILVGGRVDEVVSDYDYVEHVNRLSNKIPVVITGKLDGSDTYQVNIDQIHAMEVIMGHLLAKGHERIALLGGDSSVKSTVEKRLRYKQLLSKYGILEHDGYVTDHGSYNEESGFAEMNRILKMETLPTAVIAINDFAAIGIIRAISEAGLKVPQDISVVSFDNTYLSNILEPALTTVDYNYQLFGKVMIDSVVDLIEGREVARIQHIPTKLIERSSSRSIVKA